MLTLDGSFGEGGGQVLRTALSLSVVTGRPFRIFNIRAGRRRPGLLRQHLTAVRAAATVGEAKVEGAELESIELTFRPVAVCPGRYHFSVGTAGSATLVAQTVLPPLLRASLSSAINVEGGTHNPSAPPFEFLARAFLPLVGRLGPRLSAQLHRPGFYPAGGGSLTVAIDPAAHLRRLDLVERGELRAIRVEAVVAGVPRHVARRELETVQHALPQKTEGEIRELPADRGPGNVVIVTVLSQGVTEVFTGFGKRGVRAEQVGLNTARQVKTYLESDVAVGRQLADQLLLPLAVGAGGRFTTVAPSEHTRTNADVIRRFLDVEVALRQESAERWEVTVGS